MAIVDDILIYRKTKAEHDEHLFAMLQHSRERRVKLNPEKSYFGISSLLWEKSLTLPKSLL